MHMVRKNDQYQSMAWMCGLRGDRDVKAKQIDKVLKVENKSLAKKEKSPEKR